MKGEVGFSSRLHDLVPLGEAVCNRGDGGGYGAMRN